jgi:hypothetical protein
MLLCSCTPALYSVPCTLHPVPCTLHPTPCSLYPTPCTLHPVPYTLYPVPCTLYPAPCTHRTFLNSLRTWRSSGLLDMVSEKVALLNDPYPQEHAMALDHGLRVVQPKDIPSAKVHITYDI